LYRYDVYRRYYENAVGTEAYLARIKDLMAGNPRWFDDELAKLSAELAQTTHYVYGSRDQRYLLDAIPALLAEADEALSTPGSGVEIEGAPAPAPVETERVPEVASAKR
jgi:hypothetical protein